jgi:predicted secreted Zn-dependent protease
MIRITRARVALAITTISTIASASPALAAVQAKTKILRYAIRFNETALDLGAPGPSLGDVQVLNDKLVNHRGKVVGHDGGTCTVTSLDPPETNCTITFSLPAGQITSQFLNSPPPRKIAPVTGGTKRYRGARGDLVLTESPDQTGTIVFRFTRS